MKIMKNKIKILLAFVVLTTFACTDAVEIDQPGRFNAEIAYQSVEDLSLGLLGAYNELDITNMIGFASTFTDEISIGITNGGQGITDGRINYILDATSGAASSMWTNQYDAINASTRLIEAAAAVTPEAGEEDFYDIVLGQAYCIRAWAHFVLFTYFTTDYTDNNALCAIAVDFVPSIDDQLPRNTVGEVLALIDSDLNTATSLFPSQFQPQSTFMGPDFITALRARLAAYRQDYSNAATLAKSLSDKYPLADKDQYFNMYEDTDDTEVIFKLERNVNDPYDAQATGGGGWAGALYAFVNSTIDGSPYFEMSRALYNAFDPNDIRLERSLDPSSMVDPNYETNPEYETSDVLVIRKYPGSDGQPLLNDLKVFRASEMVLIEAEAAAAQGDLTGAASFIKEIRDARLGEDTPMMNFANEQEAFGAILDERRLEFCFEGHRYIDLKRLGQRGNRDIARDRLDCAKYGACEDSSFYPTSSRVNENSFKFTFPIPLVEQNGNAVIRDQQNPGY
jgi:hypothetical protein